MAIDGDTALVGAFHWGIPFWDPGAAFVFRFDGLDWLLQQKLVSSDGVDGDQFGDAVALDGDTLVVGATGKVRATRTARPTSSASMARPGRSSRNCSTLMLRASTSLGVP